MDEQRFKPEEFVRGADDFDSPPKAVGAIALLSLAFALVAGGMAAYVYIASSGDNDPPAPARLTSSSNVATVSRTGTPRRASSIRNRPIADSQARPMVRDTNGRENMNRPGSAAGQRSTSRSRSDIVPVIKRHLPAMERAYRKRLRTSPGMAGAVKVRFVVDHMGRVTRSEVLSSEMDDPQFDSAIARYVRRWMFPAVADPGDSSEVVFPFVFGAE
jgi:periplasmic protein TonB